MGLFEDVGERIRERRAAYRGRGISQEELAKRVGVTANTISRWETGTYRPDLDDLEKLARALNSSILDFLPGQEDLKERKLAALLRAAKALPEADIEELRRFAEFRQAEHFLRSQPRPRPGRKRKTE